MSNSEPVNDGVGGGPRRPMESSGEPLEALVSFEDVDAYEAEIWFSRTIKPFQNTVEYVYWIYVTDSEFGNKEIPDSKVDTENVLTVMFIDKSMMSLVNFKFRHFAGNVFRVKFKMDLVSGSVISQNLSLDY